MKDPGATPRDALVDAVLADAVRAPSSHNTQPWRFRRTSDGVDLFADRTRALPVNDPDDRELAISCGCALFNLRASAAQRGAGTDVALLPDPGQPDWIARVAFGRPRGAHELAALAAGIPVRRTHREAFAERDVDPAVAGQLVAAAKAEGAWFRVLADTAARVRAAELVATGDAAQWGDAKWRRELAAWMRSRRHGDGLALPALVAPVTRFVVRTFDMGRSVGAKDRDLALASPLLAVLGTHGDGARDWVSAGQALQRVLLTACRHGVQASYLNQPVQVAHLRPQLQQLAGPGHPQVLLRLGHATATLPAAPRRGVAAVVQAG
jgi:hypothetical protein